MPCTAGGTPVTMDRLLGLVKVGTTLSAMKRLPSSPRRHEKKKSAPQGPRAGGATPVTMDRLLGLVKVGTTLSAMKRLPSSSMLPMKGATPAATAAVR